MSLIAGHEIEIAVEKPAAGGRMLARHEGQVVLVLGAIPGERVRAAVERVDKQLAFATSVNVLEPSPDRRPVAADLLCGGCLYAHVAYPRQQTLKSEVIGDAFARIGRLPLQARVDVLPSPEVGYRVRARLHVQGGRAGFYREGSHELCDARATGQLSAAAMDAVDTALDAWRRAGLDVVSIETSEDLAGERRALHAELSGAAGSVEDALAHGVRAAGLAGCTASAADGRRFSAGDPYISDPLTRLTSGRAATGALRRRPQSFFQNNRYLLPALVGAVIDAVPVAGPVLDLYAGVGLFSIALAAVGRGQLIAVEGDRTSGADLGENARAWPEVRPIVGSVEAFVKGCRRGAAASIVIDPPRTGISRAALEALVRLRCQTLVYVSCDPPTMARDARRLVDAGYHLRSLQGFDFFPNTPHVETLGVFELRQSLVAT